MEEYICKHDSLPQAYHHALCILNDLGETADCADWETSQKELSMTMVVNNPLEEPMISKLFIGGPRELEQYRQEMLDGILDFEIEKGNWVYTYHDRMINYPKTWKATYSSEIRTIISDNSINQIDFVIEELKRNPSSRRAVILVREPSVDVYSNDPACLQHIQYFIRDNKLHCKVLFRSNDACKAAFMNAFALIMLQKRIADALEVGIGTYSHRANSFHCYEKDLSMLEGYVKRIRSANDEYDICFDYEDGWAEDMEIAKPEIELMVSELKNR